MDISSSIKSDLHSTHEQELSASSSNDSAIPVPYTGVSDDEAVIDSDDETDDKYIPCPLSSPSRHRNSASRSIDSIRNTFRPSLSGVSPVDDDGKGYAAEEIFGHLNEDEIQIKRMETRNTILSEIATRIHIDDSGDETIEKYDDEVENHFQLDSGLPVDNNGEEFGAIDPELITFKGFNDPEDPRNWPLKKKTYIVLFASIYTLIAPVGSSIISPALSEIAVEFNIKSNVVLAMIVSIQVLAWAFGPLLIAPLSEEDRFGRKFILDISCWMSFFFNLGCAFSQNTYQMLIFRFIGGLFSSTPLNVAPAVVSDLFDAKSRNLSLAGVFLLPLLGPVLAPVIGGYIVQYSYWRWTLYVICIFNGVIALLGTFFYKESYAPTLLKKKAAKLRKVTGNQNLHTIYEISNGETTLDKLKLTTTRPIKLLFTHPLVIGLGSFLAVVYALMYLMIVTFQSIFRDIYGFDKGTIGLMYLPMGIGFIVGVIFWTFMLEKVYTYLTEKNNGVAKPEFRLPCLVVNTGFLIPLSLLWYGWSVEKQLHWIMPAIGTGLFGFSFCCVFQALLAVLIDSIKFAASAVAAAAVFRSLFGFSFPLFADIMYARLGYGWANTIFAIIAIILGLPFPIICFKYGERIRNSANQRMEREQARRDEKILKKLQKNIKITT